MTVPFSSELLSAIRKITRDVDDFVTPDRVAAIKRIAEGIAQAEYRSTFDGAVVELEAACKFELGKAEGGPLLVENPPEPGMVPEREQPSWYAAEILAVIKRVRHHLANGEGSKAAAAAMNVGMLAAEVDARFDSPAARALRKRNETQRRISIAANVTKADTRDGRRCEVVLLATQSEYAGLSQRRLAERLASRIVRENPHDQNDETRRWGVGTIREDLGKLGLPR